MQVADPAVSRRKFDREVAQLRDLGSTLVARGIWVMQAEFPMVKVAFATVNCKPCTILFAVRIDFTDYDVQPLAITFVAPFTDRELLPNEMPTKLRRAVLGAMTQQVEMDGQQVCRALVPITPIRRIPATLGRSIAEREKGGCTIWWIRSGATGRPR